MLRALILGFVPMAFLGLWGCNMGSHRVHPGVGIVWGFLEPIVITCLGFRRFRLLGLEGNFQGLGWILPP